MADPRTPQGEESGTQQTTRSLKGITILVVVINHFMNRYMQEDTEGFAYVMISIFFILSGYGIYGSLHQRFQKTRARTQALFRFYADRALKIYPLYALALLIEGFVSGSCYSPWAYLGIKSPGHYWFINSV